MKKLNIMNQIKYILFIAVVFLFTACEDFLETRAQGSLDEEVLLNEDGIDLLLTSVYAALAPGVYLSDTYVNWISGSIAGGEANKGSSASDQPDIRSYEFYNITSSNSYAQSKWEELYDLIARANSTIKTLDKATELSEDFVLQTRGELQFLRAYAFFELRKAYHYVPYVDESYKDVDPKIYNDEDIYPHIISDLESAIENLPEVTSSGKANYWSARSLLAKVYIYQGNFSNAEGMLKDIIENGINSSGEKFSLMSNFSDVYHISMESLNTESIFSINHSTDASGSWDNTAWIFCYPVGLFSTSGYGFFQPSYDLVNSYQVNANGLPYLDNSYRGFPSVTNISSGEAISDTSITVDPRLDWTVARPDLPVKDFGMWSSSYIRDIDYGGPFFMNKFLHWDSEGNSLFGNTMNYHVIRLADVILMYAECLAENGKPEEAREYVNMIRKRAANDVVTLDNGNRAANYHVGEYTASQFDTKEKALLAIRFERKLEFALEGHRFYDLVRWGSNYAKEQLDAFTTYEQTKLVHYASTEPFDERRIYYPIPLEEIQTVGIDSDGEYYLQQNDGY